MDQALSIKRPTDLQEEELSFLEQEIAPEQLQEEPPLQLKQRNGLDDVEKDFVLTYNNQNLTTETPEVVRYLSKLLGKTEDAILSFMWREGARPKESERIRKYLHKMGNQVAIDTGFYVEDKPPQLSEKTNSILKKMLNQRILNAISSSI